MRALILGLIIALFYGCQPSGNASEDWAHHVIDSTRQKWGDWEDPDWLRYFGLDVGDLNRDGFLDIASGRYIYLNPGSIGDRWDRVVLDDNVDAIFCMDVDGDEFGDVIAMRLPEIRWYEAIDKSATLYTFRRVAEIPATSHINSQGFKRGQLIPGGREEMVIAGNGNIYMIQIPETPEDENWPTELVAANTSDEGIGVGDLDGDGDLDLAAGRRPDGADEPTILVWFENPGNFRMEWKDYEMGITEHPIDRVEIGDLDGDSEMDIVITEERYPGLAPDAGIYWFENTGSGFNWEQHHVATQYSTNNLSLTDLDGDGSLDIITAEHKGPELELQHWTNDGSGTFQKSIISTGVEHHLGVRLADLDNDDKLEILGAGWDTYNSLNIHTRSRLVSKVEEIEDGDPFATAEITYEKRPHYLIVHQGNHYYYDIQGGGFSRIIDADGNDWVSFRMEPWGEYPAGAAGAFRGIPNLVWQGKNDGAGHPGHNQCDTQLNGRSLVSETKDGLWRWRWDFEDQIVRLTVEKADPSRKYWFLYEGTPGGVFEPNEDYYGTSGSGPSSETYDYYANRFLTGTFDWFYAGHKRVERVLYFVHLTSDEETDLISHLGNAEIGIESNDGMTVWGFGRNTVPEPLLTGSNLFILGFYEQPIRNQDAHEELGRFINNVVLKK